MSIFLTIIVILTIIGFVAYKNKARIKRGIISFQLKQRQRHKLKFTFDDERQKRTIKMIEKLIRDKDSRLYHETINNNYYIEHGDIYAIFNQQMASIVNGKFNNSVLIYDALFNNLEEKFRTRVKADVKQCEARLNAKVDNIIDFINEDIHIK